jgi:hypothetical protein
MLQSNRNKNSMVLVQSRYEDKWNRIEDPDMKPHSHSYLILSKAPKTYEGEKTASSTNGAGIKIGICLQKTEMRSMPITLYEYQLRVD